MKPISHNIKTTKNTKKKDKILSSNGKEKTEEEILKEEENNILNKINNGLFSENTKTKLIYINFLKNEIEKLKSNDFHKESNLLKDIYEPKYFEIYNLISDIVSAKDSSLFLNKLTEEDYKTYNIIINPEINEETLEYQPIENFWLNVIENTCYFKVSEEDKNILKKLVKIHSNLTINNETGDIYKIIFYFDENDYFTDKEIIKTYFYNKNGDEKVEKVEFPKIEWKEGKKTKDSFFDMFDEQECKLEESRSEVNFIRNDFFPNILEFFMNFQDDSEGDSYDNYIK
jgi:nucleosome assembly protein 1-like 1